MTRFAWALGLHPSCGLDALRSVIGIGMDDKQATGVDLFTFLEMMMVSAGMGYLVQVNDCETSGDWTESDNGTFDYAVGATGKRVGTNCLAITNTAATDASQYIETKFINESAKADSRLWKRQQDWGNTRYLGFWKHAESSAHFGTAGELQVAIVNNGTVSSKVNVDGTNGTTHHYCQIDMESNSWTRDRVEALRFYGNHSVTGEVTYIDDIVRYQVSYDRGPLYGAAFPIKSAEALSDGDTVGWSIDGLVKSSSAAAVTDLGPVKLYGADGLPASSRTGTAVRGVWGFVPGCYIFIGRANAATIAGEGLEWAANGLYAGVSTGVDELGFAKGFEAAGAQYDDIFMTKTFGGNFIT